MDLPSEIVIGDDYLAANGRAITWSFDAITGVASASDLTCKFGIKASDGNSVVITGTVSSTHPHTTWVASVDIAKADLQGLPDGLATWSTEVSTAGGTEITIAQNELGCFLRLRNKQT